MGAGLLILSIPLFFYVVLASLFCVMIASKTSPKMGWLVAAGLVGMPLALLLGWITAAAA
ncbi:hypothetical protein [Streptomyces sp. NPDC051218]|uniref:hypothetical protein n=1 Tax=Streptomyces sp. NPDC051218 TaxID=3365645 RepID=UPI00379A0272